MIRINSRKWALSPSILPGEVTWRYGASQWDDLVNFLSGMICLIIATHPCPGRLWPATVPHFSFFVVITPRFTGSQIPDQLFWANLSSVVNFGRQFHWSCFASVSQEHSVLWFAEVGRARWNLKWISQKLWHLCCLTWMTVVFIHSFMTGAMVWMYSPIQVTVLETVPITTALGGGACERWSGHKGSALMSGLMSLFWEWVVIMRVNLLGKWFRSPLSLAFGPSCYSLGWKPSSDVAPRSWTS